MQAIVCLLALGSFLIAMLLTYQVKMVQPNFIEISKYNIYIIPLMLLANISLGMGFIKGHQIIKNLPLLIAMQTFIYYLIILGFSIVFLGDKIAINKAVAGFILIVTGIWLLKS